VPSSTSNSSLRAPDGPWIRIWVIALIIAALALAGLEAGWRSRGFQPESPDNRERWVLYREAATSHGSDTVALVGSSRFQLDIDPDLLSRGLGGRPVQQLAINGGSPFPILENLARDKDFEGTAVVEYTPARFSTSRLETWAKARSFVSAWKSRSWDLPMEMAFRSFVQQRLALIRSDLSVITVLNKLIKERELPRPNYMTVLPNRHIRGDYALVDAAALDRKWAAGYASRDLLTPEGLDERISLLAGWVSTIEGRGGRVVFVRINSDATTRALEADRFPRASQYERYRSKAGGEWIHFEDDPVLREISCGDGSHIDQANVPVLSARLAELLLPMLSAPQSAPTSS
jgi:hypothetical protein